MKYEDLQSYNSITEVATMARMFLRSGNATVMWQKVLRLLMLVAFDVLT